MRNKLKQNIENYKQVIIKYIFHPFNVFRYFESKIFNYYIEIIIDNLSYILYDKPVIGLKEFKGKFIINSESDLFKRILKNRNYEEKLAIYCERYIDKNKDFIDAGANIGFYSIMAAKIVNKGRKVVAIEPTENAYNILQKNIFLNNVSDKIKIIKKAAIDKIDLVEIKTVKNREEYSTLGSNIKHKAVKDMQFEIEKVNSTTIDNIVINESLKPGFIKIDVEGSEYLLLKGAKKTIQKYRPKILIEINHILLSENNSSSDEVIEFLKKYEYKFINPINPGLINKKCNIFCIPIG